MSELPPGAILHRGFLNPAAQRDLAREISGIVSRAPLFISTMPRTGAPMSVRMTNCGPLGWLSDKDGGYRYEPRHPVTGEPWPAIPEVLLNAWKQLADCPAAPEACLINVYDADARMGLHQDRDERIFRRLSFPCPWARIAAFESARQSGAARPSRLSSPPATLWFWAESRA